MRMNWFYYLTHDESLIYRVRSSARPATYNVPIRTKAWAVFAFVDDPEDGSNWVLQARLMTLSDLDAMHFIGWTPLRL